MSKFSLNGAKGLLRRTQFDLGRRRRNIKKALLSQERWVTGRNSKANPVSWERLFPETNRFNKAIQLTRFHEKIEHGLEICTTKMGPCYVLEHSFKAEQRYVSYIKVQFDKISYFRNNLSFNEILPNSHILVALSSCTFCKVYVLASIVGRRTEGSSSSRPAAILNTALLLLYSCAMRSNEVRQKRRRNDDEALGWWQS